MRRYNDPFDVARPELLWICAVTWNLFIVEPLYAFLWALTVHIVVGVYEYDLYYHVRYIWIPWCLASVQGFVEYLYIRFGIATCCAGPPVGAYHPLASPQPNTHANLHTQFPPAHRLTHTHAQCPSRLTVNLF